MGHRVPVSLLEPCVVPEHLAGMNRQVLTRGTEHRFRPVHPVLSSRACLHVFPSTILYPSAFLACLTRQLTTKNPQKGHWHIWEADLRDTVFILISYLKAADYKEALAGPLSPSSAATGDSRQWSKGSSAARSTSPKEYMPPFLIMHAARHHIVLPLREQLWLLCYFLPRSSVGFQGNRVIWHH